MMHRFRLTPMQEGMLYESLNGKSRYISTLQYTLDAPADAEALAQRLNLLTERHEALRTCIIRDDSGVFWQEVGEHDQGHFRISLTNPNCLSVEFNHAILDGWSIGVLMAELSSPDEPSGKPSPFRYYVKWLERRDETEDLRQWREYLADTAYTELPGRQRGNGCERNNLRFTLPDSDLLRKRAQELHVTAGRLIQAVWGILLARYSGGISVVPNVVSGRGVPVPGVPGMVGMCVNTVPVVTKLPMPPESKAFAAWIAEWSRLAVETERRGFCRLSDLIKGPLPHLLAIDPSFDGAGYRLKSTNADPVTDFDAAFTLGDGIKAEFAYNATVYSPEAATAIKNHFLTALAAVLENPYINMEKIPILTETEISELTAFEDDDEIINTINTKTVADLWIESSAAHSEHIALVCGEVRLTYAELSDRVCRMAAALRERGVSSETPVAIKLGRSERYVIAELAIMYAGGFFIPLDPEWPDKRINTIIEETCPLLVMDEVIFAELSNTAYKPLSAPAPQPDDAAYMIMTSGTTGIPKGVVITQRNFSCFCLWARKRYGWKPGDASALVMGFGFDGSLWDIWLPLISGGTLHVLRDDVRFDIRALGGYCKAEKITHIDLPVALADSFREMHRGDNTLPDLRVTVTGGEEVHRVVSAPYALSNEYGPTECTVCCCAGWANEGDSPVSIGTPPVNTRVYLLDEWGWLCPYGVAGEAYFSGPQIARGYFNAPDLTALRFIANPFANGDLNHGTMYRTGDLLKWQKRNGMRELMFMGRTDNQVKIRGYRVELGETESLLLTHPSVKAAVAAVKGDTDKSIIAYVVTEGTVDVSELHKLLSERLPAFMLPTIVAVDSIPINTSGKVDYSRLPMPEAGNSTEYSIPITEAEKALVTAVSEMLDTAGIGTSHNYIELGGNSINAMRLVVRLEHVGWAITAPEILSSGNLAALAEKMHQTEIVRKEDFTDTTFVPLDVQRGMVFLSETEGTDMYTVTLCLSAEDVTEDELRVRLDRAAALHDILRADFVRSADGNIMGIIRDKHRIPLVTDTREPVGGINPLLDPPVDLTLKDGELILRYHHIALDGFGIGLLTEELLTGKFPETAPSFAVFANRLNTRTEQRAADETWWREYCSGADIVPLLRVKTAEYPEYKRTEFCSPELLSLCTEAAKSMRVTLAAFTLTAWCGVLHALGGGGDILVPFVASCRDDDRLMGMCAAVYPLRFKVTDGTFADMALRVREAVQECTQHVFFPPGFISFEYLFAFDDAAGFSGATGVQSYDLVINYSGKGEIIYDANRFDGEFISFLASKLKAALKAALINEASLFSDGEYKLVTKKFSLGRVLNVKYKTAAEAFLSAVSRYPGHIALETESLTLTYSQLSELALALKDRLALYGIGAGDTVACCLSRTADGIIAPIGIMLSGAAFLPLEPTWPQSRIDSILSDSGAAAVIRDGLNIEITGERANVPDDTAYIIYTSGTTGKPKGVVIPNAALANQIAWTLDEFGFSCTDKMLHYIAFTFDPSVWTIFATLSSGAAVSLITEELRLDPAAVAHKIDERSITLCTLPAAISADVLRRTTGSRLRLVFFGGESPKNLPTRAINWDTVNLYGPTETCINATFRRMQKNETETRNIGIPVANTACYVLDPYGNPCSIGIKGELYIAGVQLAHGYLNRPDETSAAFSIHPRFGRVYRTGDRAVWTDDGTLEFLGREDDQVKIRGYRVELGEIENALRDIEGVADAKVKFSDGIPDAYVIMKQNASTACLKDRLTLPAYMLPRTITAVDIFPLTVNGKVDIAVLPMPTFGTEIQGLPVTETEKAVAAAWKTALAFEYEIGRGDDFFDLGGHSLLLFRVLGLLATSGISVDIKTLIKHSVLSDLADEIDRTEHTAPLKKAAAGRGKNDAYKLYVREAKKVNLSAKRPLNNILITGGTGFLGSHLIYEFFTNTLATIHLPVRGGTERISGAMNYYFGTKGAEMAASERLRISSADISEKPVEINMPLDAIFHTAADIRHYAPEAEMYKANVTATEHMLKLAAQQPNLLLAHISTTSAANVPFIRENDTNLGSAFDNTYQRTKQIAEQRVLDAGKNGLKYAIFRIGHISPSLSTGAFAMNSDINATLRLLKSMFLTCLLPKKDDAIGFGFVDKTALAIRLLSEPENLDGRIFHIDNPKKIKLSSMFELIGIPARLLPRGKLASALREILTDENTDEAVRQAASEYLGRISQGDLEKSTSDITAGKLKMDATLALLKRLGFEWPEVTGEYLKNLRNFQF